MQAGRYAAMLLPVRLTGFVIGDTPCGASNYLKVKSTKEGLGALHPFPRAAFSPTVGPVHGPRSDRSPQWLSDSPGATPQQLQDIDEVLKGGTMCLVARRLGSRAATCGAGVGHVTIRK
ncbi:hypothetical protein GGTG_14355, partial [Gaeumannomyces tritici R3-111a-1]